MPAFRSTSKSPVTSGWCCPTPTWKAPETRGSPSGPSAAVPGGDGAHRSAGLPGILGFAPAQDHLERIARLQVHVALDKRDLDAGLGEAPVNLAVQVVHGVEAGVETRKVAPQGQVQRAFAETLENHQWARLLEHLEMFLRRVEHDGERLVGVRTVGDADVDDHSVDGIGQGPVEQAAGDELLVRNDEFALVPVANGGGADANPRDHAVGVAERDDVADAYRPLEKQDDTADEVGDDLLQAEAESDAESSHEPLQLRPVGADDAEADYHADGYDEVAGDGDGGV